MDKLNFKFTVVKSSNNVYINKEKILKRPQEEIEVFEFVKKEVITEFNENSLKERLETKFDFQNVSVKLHNKVAGCETYKVELTNN